MDSCAIMHTLSAPPVAAQGTPLHLSMTCVRMRVAPPQNVAPQLLHVSWGDVSWSRVIVTESHSGPSRPVTALRGARFLPSECAVEERPRRDDP